MSISRKYLLNSFILGVVFLGMLLLLIPGLVISQSTNTCLQVLMNSNGDLTYDENNDGKVNLMDCMVILFPPDLGTVISDANATLLDLANDPNPDIEQMQAVSIGRSAALLELIPQDPGGAYDVLLSEADRNTILTAANNDPVVVENIEEPFDENGTLTIYEGDIIDIGESETTYELEVEMTASNNDGGLLNKLAGKLVGKVHAQTTSTYSIHSAQPMPNVSSNSNVDVVGMELLNLAMIGSDPASSSITVVQEQPVETIGEKTVLYLPVYFSNTEDDPGTPDFNEQEPLSTEDLEYIHDLVDSRLYENSYGKSWLSSAWVMPAVEIMMETPPDCDDIVDMHEDIMFWTVLANDIGVDFDQFPDGGTIVVLYPDVPGGCKFNRSDIQAGWGTRGLGRKMTNEREVVAGKIYVNMAEIELGREIYSMTIFHELLHNYGLGHANFLECGADDEMGSLQDCESKDHDDQFDTMGYWVYEGWNTNLLNREHLEWLDTEYIDELDMIFPYEEYLIDIVPRGISPIPADSTLLVKFPSDSIDGGDVYAYIEYIQRLGYDDANTNNPTVFNGATIHVKSEDFINEGFSHLVDTTPGSNPDNDGVDAHLLVGESVTFPYGSGVTVEVCSADADILRVAINRSCITPTNKIAFVSNRDGNNDIYVINEDGTGLINVTNNSADNKWPSLARNGSLIVYSSGPTSTADVYTITPDGLGTPNNLTDSSDPVDSSGALYPALSPNASLIVYSPIYLGPAKLFTMNVDGSNKTNITDTNHQYADWAGTFTSDNSRIAFVSNRNVSNFTYDIYIMNSDGTNLTRLTNNTANDFYPQISPDNTKIVFERNAQIYIMNIDGSGEQLLSDGTASDLHPSFSPDGTRIAFYTNRDGNNEIYTMDINGDNLTNITNDPANDFWPTFGLAN